MNVTRWNLLRVPHAQKGLTPPPLPFQLCGMCGNYNNNPSDDDLMPNNQPAKDVIELGNSWKSDGDSDPGLVLCSVFTS